jgi:hypothetical protein
MEIMRGYSKIFIERGFNLDRESTQLPFCNIRLKKKLVVVQSSNGEDDIRNFMFIDLTMFLDKANILQVHVEQKIEGTWLLVFNNHVEYEDHCHLDLTGENASPENFFEEVMQILNTFYSGQLKKIARSQEIIESFRGQMRVKKSAVPVDYQPRYLQ